MSLTQEQIDFRAVLRDFAASEIAPHAQAWDREHVFPVEAVHAMGDLGLFGLIFDEDHGGSGADFTTLCIAIEEIGRADQSMGITLEAGVCLGAKPIAEFGSAEQKAVYLPDLVSGRRLAGFGLTEPDGGSDAGATKTRAVLEGSGAEAQWVIDGAKTFITNSGADITSLVTVTALTDEGVSSIIVPSGTEGFIVEPPYRKLGWHASDTHGLVFDGCRVPEANLLGRAGQGFQQFLSTLDDGRIAIAALAVGLIQACLDECIAYAKQRQAFGKSIGSYQAVAFKCADMAVAAETARQMTYTAAALKDAGEPFKKEAAIAKLYATEAAVSATREATQIFGGYGFIDETPVARFYRDAKILEIGEGTSEIQRLVISRELGLGASA
ncbi:MAG: acyl-CoA dehydrogenase family protein [Acidimicrobiaceae bacterium]|nr:acyl-CoA dehydrogenase family protein [Acidimicrobiaceae bacterium]MCY4294371.1 acyl-CoA dehydrogenase family protein [Acidimicrobiaceae bacterium]